MQQEITDYARHRQPPYGDVGKPNYRTLRPAALADTIGAIAGPHHGRAALHSLSYPSDQQTRALKACGRKIGRRVYYPATEVARIIIGTSDE